MDEDITHTFVKPSGDISEIVLMLILFHEILQAVKSQE